MRLPGPPGTGTSPPFALDESSWAVGGFRQSIPPSLLGLKALVEKPRVWLGSGHSCDFHFPRNFSPFSYLGDHLFFSRPPCREAKSYLFQVKLVSTFFFSPIKVRFLRGSSVESVSRHPVLSFRRPCLVRRSNSGSESCCLFLHSLARR